MTAEDGRTVPERSRVSGSGGGGGGGDTSYLDRAPDSNAQRQSGSDHQDDVTYSSDHQRDVTGPDYVTQPTAEATEAVAASKPARKLNCRDIIIIANVVTGNLLFSSVASVIVPFFPAEAESRHVPQAWVGTVFSAHAVTMLVTSPLAGRAVPVIGASCVFQLGLVLTGVATVAFGLLDRLDSAAAFVAASAAARMAEALGTVAAYTAGCTIFAHQFPERVHFLFSLGETMVGVGMAAGPALGGLLYDAAGYGAPFFALGGLTVAAAVASWGSLPALGGRQQPAAGVKPLLQLLRCPEAALNAAVVVTVAAGYTALRPGLAPFAEAQLGVSPAQLGLYFLLAGGTYALTGPLVGKLCDRLPSTYPLMTGCLVLAAVGLAMFCPPPPLPLPPSRPLLVTGMVVRELCLGGALIPTFGNLLHAATGAGLADSVGTQALVSAVWAAAFSSGSVLGPLAGGLLTDAAGFSAAVAVFSALVLLMALPALLLACSPRHQRRSGAAAPGKEAAQDGTGREQERASAATEHAVAVSEHIPLLE